MKVKALYKKFNEYDILLFGRPLEQQTIPFSFLPSDNKELNEMKVAEYKVIEKYHEAPRFSIKLRYRGTDKYKGYVMAYCVKEVKDDIQSGV